IPNKTATRPIVPDFDFPRSPALRLCRPFCRVVSLPPPKTRDSGQVLGKRAMLVGSAGGQFVIVPGGPPMHLTATGNEQRRALVLNLHESSQPATTPADHWAPKGLCNN